MLQLSVGKEEFFYASNEGGFKVVSMNLYDQIRFIDSILSGELRKEVLPDLRNGAFVYFTKDTNELAGFSLLGYVGYNEFCRKVFELYDREETKIRTCSSSQGNSGIIEFLSRFVS